MSSKIGFNPYTGMEYNSTNAFNSTNPKNPPTLEKLKPLKKVGEIVLTNAYFDWQLILKNPHASSHQIKRGRRELTVIRRLLKKISYANSKEKCH